MKQNIKMKFYKNHKFFFLILKICFFTKINFAQSLLSEQAAIDLALQKHPQLAKNSLNIRQAEILVQTARAIPQPLVYADVPNKWFNLGIEQNFALPKTYKQNEIALKQKIKVAKAEKEVAIYDIALHTRLLYQHFLFYKTKNSYLKNQDSLFQELHRIVSTQYKVGQISGLEQLNLESFHRTVHQAFRISELEVENSRTALEAFLMTSNIQTSDTFQKRIITSLITTPNRALPIQMRNEQNIILEKALFEQQKMVKMPTFFAGLNQLFSAQFQFPVFRLGVYVPIWTKPLDAQIQSAELSIQIAQKEAELTDFELKNLFQKYVNEFKIADNQLAFYEKEQLPLAATILQGTQKARKAGELEAFAEILSLRQAFEVQLGYLNALKAYNEAIIYLNYFK